MYTIPTSRHKTLMKGLRFSVPLVRFVIPLDSLQSRPLAMHLPAGLPLQMLLRIIRIERPLENFLPRPKASPEIPPPCPEPIPSKVARKKKTNPSHKSSGARARKASPRQNRV